MNQLEDSKWTSAQKDKEGAQNFSVLAIEKRDPWLKLGIEIGDMREFCRMVTGMSGAD